MQIKYFSTIILINCQNKHINQKYILFEFINVLIISVSNGTLDSIFVRQPIT